MPAPLIVGVAALAAEVAGIVAVYAAVLGLAESVRDSLREAVAGLIGDVLVSGVNATIVALAESNLGVQLDEDDPLSVGSITDAVSQLTGVAFTDITNSATSQGEIVDYAIGEIAAQAGVEGVTDVESLVAALKAVAMAELTAAIEGGEFTSIEGLEDLVEGVLSARCLKRKDDDENREAKKEANRKRQAKWRENNPHNCDC